MNMFGTERNRRPLLATIYLLGILGILASGGGGGGGDSVDTVAPTVSPGPQVNAPRNQVVAIFSEPMNGATINPSSFQLEDSTGTPVTGSVSYSGVTAVFTPTTQLANSSDFIVTISTDAQDLAGNWLATEASWPIKTASGNVRISWNENPETAVNRSGGGYRVYYSANSGFDPGDSGVAEIDVPWTSGASTPTTVVVTLSPGIYYIRIAAYSLLNPPGSSGGSSSAASPQFTLSAP
jgi:hypothetical protein